MAVILNASTSSGFVQSADTSGEINLQSNGSTKLTVASTGVSGVITQGTAVASTSGTSIDFTGIPSWAKRITVNLSGISSNTATQTLLIQIGDSGGIENTGYFGGYLDSNGGSALTTGQAIVLLSVIADSYSGQVTINSLTGNTWSFSCGGYGSGYGSTAGGGAKTLSATLDRVRITFASGTATFDAGTINIQYEG
jgi:hypothetical protein